MFFLLFHQFSLSFYDRRFLTSVVTERIDEKAKTFKCRFDSKLIPLDNLNDNVCDCCDCSDEFVNVSIAQKNNCKIQEKIENRAQLLTFYKESIAFRNELLKTNNKKITRLQNKLSNLVDDINQQEKLYNQTRKKLRKAKYNLVKWAYEKNNIQMPSPEEIERQKQEYINKDASYYHPNEFSFYSPRKDSNEDEEEGEGFSPPNVRYSQEDEYEIEQRRKRRAAKFDKEQKEKTKEIIRKAAEKSRPYGSFMSRLMQDSQMPQEIIDVEKLREIKKNIQININTLEMKKSKLDLHSHYIEMGPLWYKASRKSFKKNIEGEEGNLNVILFHFANAALSTGHKDLGQYSSLNGTIMQYINKNNVEEDGLNMILSVHMICSASDVIYSARKLCPSRYEAYIGIPEICEEKFSNEGFNQFISESKPFQNKVLSSTVEL